VAGEAGGEDAFSIDVVFPLHRLDQARQSGHERRLSLDRDKAPRLAGEPFRRRRCARPHL
jgi:hypothetical protein